MSKTELENIYYKQRYFHNEKVKWILVMVIVLLFFIVALQCFETDKSYDVIKKQEEKITELEKEVKYYKAQCNELEDLNDLVDIGVGRE